MPDGKQPVFVLSPLDILAPHKYIVNFQYLRAIADPIVMTTTLRVALTQTINEIPTVAGCVSSNTQDAQKGSLVVGGPYLTADDILSVKDLRDTYSYEDLRAKRFPTDAINADLVTPNLPENFPRALLAQLNIIYGGIILTVAASHSVVDGQGLINVLRVWSRFCQGGHGGELVGPHWTDRSPLMHRQGDALSQEMLMSTYTPQGYKDSSSETTIEAPGSPSTVHPSTVEDAIFFFSDARLAQLKIAATKVSNHTGENGRQSKDWISTNDALCALLWCSITSARAGEDIEKSTTISHFNMAVDGRNRLSPPISKDYIGNVNLITKAWSTFRDLVSPSPSRIADAASLIRASLLPINDTYIKGILETIRNSPDVSQLMPPHFPSFQRNVFCTSWAALEYYALDWGTTLGGRCERFRVIGNKINEGAFALLPRIPRAEGSTAEDSGIEVLLELNQEHMQRLCKDETFRKYAQWQSG